MKLSRLDPANPDEIAALATLERAVLEHDGTPLKLEWAHIREGRTVASLVGYEDGELIAYLGVYSYGGPPEAELIGMVHPRQRRRGIATALLDHAMEICAEHGLSHRLLIVPRRNEPARRFVARRRATLKHSEFSLRLSGEPRQVPEHPDTVVRDATPEDRAARMAILTAGFGPPPEAMLDSLHGDGLRTVMVEHAGAVVGTAGLRLVGDRGAVYGFAVDPEYRGRGIGRDALGRFCALLRRDGADQIRLEVAVDNERALGLYTVTGFVPVSTEDYYLLPTPGS